MGLRVRRSVKLFSGVRLNLSKGGPSLSVGGRGVTQNFSTRGTRTTFSLPGTGVSYTTTSRKGRNAGGGSLLGAIVILLILGAIVRALLHG
jgi:hypothetical protein